MTPVEILERAKCANRRIAQISAERAQLEQELQTLKSFDYSKPVVRSSSGRGEIEANAVRIADRERQLEDDLQRQLEYRHNAMVLIAALPSLKERVILFHRYILGEKWTEVAKHTHYERRYCIKLRNEALEKMTPKDTI